MVARRRPAEKAADVKKPPVLAERRLVGQTRAAYLPCYWPRFARALAAMRMRSAFSLMKPPASAWL